MFDWHVYTTMILAQFCVNYIQTDVLVEKLVNLQPAVQNAYSIADYTHYSSHMHESFDQTRRNYSLDFLFIIPLQNCSFLSSLVEITALLKWLGKSGRKWNTQERDEVRFTFILQTYYCITHTAFVMSLGWNLSLPNFSSICPSFSRVNAVNLFLPKSCGTAGSFIKISILLFLVSKEVYQFTVITDKPTTTEFAVGNKLPLKCIASHDTAIKM